MVILFGLVTKIPMLGMIMEYESSLNEWMPLPACVQCHIPSQIYGSAGAMMGDRIYYVISVSRASP